MKQEYYITITGTSHYYGMRPFSVGKRFKCVKEPSNPYDSRYGRINHSLFGHNRITCFEPAGSAFFSHASA